jgi:hypothetical protein
MSLRVVNEIDATVLLVVVPQAPERVTEMQAVQGVAIFKAKSSEV